MNRHFLSLATGIPMFVAALLLVSCRDSSQVDLPTSADPLLQRIVADHQANCLTGLCPNPGSNCSVKSRSEVPQASFSEYDNTIAQGSSAIASYFQDLSESWQDLLPEFNVAEPDAYAHLTAGDWQIVKYTNSGGVWYVMGAPPVTDSTFALMCLYTN